MSLWTETRTQSNFVEDSDFSEDSDSGAGDEYFTDDDDDAHSTMPYHSSANGGINDDLASDILAMDIAIDGSTIDGNATKHHDLVDAALENPVASYSESDQIEPTFQSECAIYFISI